jgi:hypothetical protein
VVGYFTPVTTLSGVALPEGSQAEFIANWNARPAVAEDARTGEEAMRLFIELAHELASRLGLATAPLRMN